MTEQATAPESPLVRDYLACFSEVARLVNNAADVPDDIWTRIRELWAVMSEAEREAVEARVRGKKR